ncbi:hypothetical protein KC347_g1771 [Hortaea werneckii]|nr:hypothetical protein KC347_g1771 [Hortaea werneckii]
MPSGGKGEMKWDAEADRKLFLGVLKVHDIKINYQALAQFMTTDSVKPTALGIQNRMSKLKSMVKSSCICYRGYHAKREVDFAQAWNSTDDSDACGTKAKVPETGKPTKAKAEDEGNGEQNETQEAQAGYDSSAESWLA